MSQRSDSIHDLEKINQIIDLCIDREIYSYLNDIIELSDNALKYIELLHESKGETAFEEFGFENFEFPVEKINIPIKILSKEAIQQLFRSETSYDLKKLAETEPLLKNWSDLFWVKRIRGELQYHNKSKWNDRYEELITFLNSRIPLSKLADLEKDNQIEIDFAFTKFNYLMEQSATATSEASYGYAERARDSLKKLSPDFRGPYDRWISWNKGLAYQHMVGRNREAVLEFNWVIKEFWYQEPWNSRKQLGDIILGGPKGEHKKYFDIVLEFLINIVPAYLQRAVINLKLQLGYHALQTLNDDLNNILEKIEKNKTNTIFSKAALHLQQRINLQQIEALLQLDVIKDAGKYLQKAHDGIFDDKNWKPGDVTLPQYKEDSSQKAIKTQLVEHTVKWFFQKANELLSILRKLQNKSEIKKDPCDKDNSEEVDQAFTYLEEFIEIFFNDQQESPSYWGWVKDNNQDKLIYFSRWAQLLKLGMETVCELDKLIKEHPEKLKNAPDPTRLLKATIKLYLAQSTNLPVVRKNRLEGKPSIEIENLRSDDFPDFTSGLSSFYKNVSDILLHWKEESLSESLGKEAKKTLKEEKKTINQLKKDHLQLLAALDEYEIEFGENQQIKAIKRANEKLFWSQDAIKECEGCLDADTPECDSDNSQKPYYFDGLLACYNKPKAKKDDFLYCEDYQNIMQKVEGHLLEHLQKHSQQEPPKKALHFVGLQRWNSLTPAQGRSVGGGYLIYRTDDKGQVDLGIALDPGFDFVRNLFRMGFSLRDIDIVIISHAHADHLWDFESMVQLAHELEEKEKITHRFNVIMTLGVYERLSHIIKNPGLRKYINPLVVDIRKEIDRNFFHKIGKSKNYNFKFKKKEDNNGNTICWQPILPLPGNKEKGEIEICPTRAYHEDYTHISDSFGFVIRILDAASPKKNLQFGYTGDTKWVDINFYSKEKSGVASQYQNCDVLLFHIGSLIDHKRKRKFTYYEPDKCAKLIRKENHPYLMGTIRFLKKLGYPYPKLSATCKKKLILLGEFGEELRGGIRTDLVKRLQGKGDSDWPIVPVDVGFDVLLDEDSPTKENSNGRFKFLCSLCDEHQPIEDIDYFRFGQDEAIFHICKTCMKATPDDVRQTKLRKLYEIGRELRTLPESIQKNVQT